MYTGTTHSLALPFTERKAIYNAQGIRGEGRSVGMEYHSHPKIRLLWRMILYYVYGLGLELLLLAGNNLEMWSKSKQRGTKKRPTTSSSSRREHPQIASKAYASLHNLNLGNRNYPYTYPHYKSNPTHSSLSNFTSSTGNAAISETLL